MVTLQVGVKALLKNKAGKILILKRVEDKYGKTDGSWDIVGGRIEPGTALVENLAREIREETRLALNGEPRLIAAQDILTQERHVVRLTYIAFADGEPSLDMTENSAYRWVTFDELVAEGDLDTYVRRLLTSGTLRADSWG